MAAAIDGMRSVNSFEAIKADDPFQLAVLLNLAGDAIESRGGVVLHTHLPDMQRWVALDQRYPLFAMIEYVLPRRDESWEPTRPLHSGPVLWLVPSVGSARADSGSA